MTPASIAGYIPVLLFGFAIGSIPFGVFVGRVFFKRDLRASGSGNIGAANALRTFGPKAGLAVLGLDALKGAVAVIVAARLGGTAIAPLVGLAAIAGHCYSPWLRLRGGKGVATFLGAASALSWEAGAVFGIVWMVAVLPTGFSSLGSMLATLAAGAVIVAAAGSRHLAGPPATANWIFSVGCALLIVWKHRENIVRLRAGTENRLTLLKR